ncbi:hypothetical protein MNBD_GAMMA12-3853 [hydrothermal vent metagenome]|uniref:DUF4189 domain-containing protein n=1 Tax=hydrothermal vent metagenome TaxID=652676 RepID=A0A3B0YMT9_9ZZZZ
MKKSILLFLLIFLIPSVSIARNYWGALAYDKQTGRTTYSKNHYTAYKAKRAALHRCGRHCRIISTYVNTCIAMAKGHHGAYGIGKSRNLRRAQQSSRRQCRHRGRSCRVVVSSCNARRHYRRPVRHH